MMSGDFFEEGPYPDHLIFLWMGLLTAASGALVGGGESYLIVWQLKLFLEVSDLVLLGLASVLVNAAVGLGCGLAGGLVGQLFSAKLPRWRRYRFSFTLASVLLLSIYLTPVAYSMLKSALPERAYTVAILAIIAPVTIWFNAGYWFRRMAIGAGPELGWRIVAAAVGVLLGLSCPLALVNRPPEGGSSEDPNLILITVDTLRRDALGIYGGSAATPNMDRLAREGVWFTDAVTPVPETAPSHASMFTGRHPLEHRVIANGQPLTTKKTLAAQVGLQGYATGAFVSSFAVDSSSGLDYGFTIYDDDFFPLFRGFSEIHAAGILLKVLMRVADPTDYPFLLERKAPDTLERALAWAEATNGPMFLWVHLFEPHSPYERHDGQPEAVDHREILKQEPGYAYNEQEIAALKELYRLEVEYTDTQIGALLDSLKAAGKLENAVVLLIADHGESLGEHGIYFNHHGIYEEVLQVPLMVWASNPKWAINQHISGMVTVLDVANTLLMAGGLAAMTETHSEPLMTRAMGASPTPESLLLLGREGMSLQNGTLYGIRSPNGLKYLQRQEGGEEFYDCVEDPKESRNIASEQPRGVELGRRGAEGIKQALNQSSKKAVDASTEAMLEALGYAEGAPEPVGGGQGCW